MELDSFHVKKIIGNLFDPKFISLMILLAGAFWVFRTRVFTGICLIVAAAATLFISALPITGFLLIHPLEVRAGNAADADTITGEGITSLVVLQDVAEAAELWKRIPGSKIIILSGDCGTRLLQAARETGLPEHLIIWEDQPRDTLEQAERLRSLLPPGERFALVTWASHMPRALLTFEKLSLKPFPVPLAFTKPPQSPAAALWPSLNGPATSRRAIHEYVGIAWLFIGTSLKNGAAALIR